jgi:Card1-like, endonuclease domain
VDTVLVSLVGAQTIPNVLFIKEVEDELGKDIRRHLFVSTQAMEDKGKTESIIRGSHIERSSTDIVKVVEDSIENIDSKLTEFTKEKLNSEDNFIVNLTGGTKTMSIAVYNFFKAQKSTIYYLPIGKNIYKQISPPVKQGKHRLNFRISLRDYLISYEVEIKSKDITRILKSKRYTERLFRAFLDNKIDMEIIGKLRKERNKKKVRLDEKTKSFLDEIKFDTEKEGSINKKEINYLTGGWLEEYVYNLVEEHIQLDDDKVGINVQISHDKTQNEFDVMFVHENTLYVIECKTALKDGERNLLNDTLYKLSALNKDFGLNVRGYLFTLDRNLRNPEGEIKKDYQNRADLLGVALVDGAILGDEKKLNEIFDKIKGGVKNV